MQMTFETEQLVASVQSAVAPPGHVVSRLARGPLLVGPQAAGEIGMGLLASVEQPSGEHRVVGLAYTAQGEFTAFVDRSWYGIAPGPEVAPARDLLRGITESFSPAIPEVAVELQQIMGPEVGAWNPTTADTRHDKDAITTLLAAIKEGASGIPAPDVLAADLSSQFWDLYNPPAQRGAVVEWNYLRGSNIARVSEALSVQATPTTVEVERAQLITQERKRLLGIEPRMREILPCIDPDCPVKYPVFLVGGPGSGKSTSLHLLGTTEGRMFDRVITVGAHAGMTSWDFIGGPKIDKSGWHHGPVARAFLEAAEGKKTLLLVDEVNRVPVRERSVFLTALSHNHETKSFHLTVSGFSDAAKSIHEEIKAPYANLSICMTGNTDDCAVESAEKALDDRFRFVMFPITEDLIRRGMTRNCLDRGYPGGHGERFVKLMHALQKLHDQHQLKQMPTMRGLARALDTAKVLDPTCKDIGVLRSQLEAESYTWVKRKGLEPIKEQMDGVLQAIGKAFA